eukprot:jgi/Botrbrau1/23399/Bobra.0051s0045.2
MATAHYHMLAIFNAQLTRPPMGLDVLRVFEEKRHPLDEEERTKLQRACSEKLETAAKHISAPQDKQKRVELGNGNGLICEVGPYCHYAERDGVFAMCSGELAELPSHIDLVGAAHDAYIRGDDIKPDANDAAWLLDLYDSFKQFVAEDVAESALSTLCNLRGQFAFVIFDRTFNRVLAARDAFGGQPLFWGTTDDGRFMFGSRVDDLLECNPSATLFPAGSLFLSEGNSALACSPGDKGWFISCDWAGQLFSFIPGMTIPRRWRDVKVIPRVKEDGTVCGAVFRVASERIIAGQPLLALPPCIL